MNIPVFKKNTAAEPPADDSPHYYYSGKYTLPAAAVVVLTLLLGGVLATDYVYSRQLNRLAIQMEASGRLHGEILNLSDLARKQVEQAKHRTGNPANPETAGILQSAQAVENLLVELGPHGQYALSEAAQPRLNRIQTIWQEYRRNLPAANDAPHKVIVSLGFLNTHAQNNKLAAVGYFHELNTTLLKESRQTADAAKNFQLSGMLFIFLGLLLFAYLLLRQIKVDRQLEADRLETHEILDTLSEGLFLLDKNMNVGSQQSQTLNDLLPQACVNGENFLDVVAEILPDRKKLSAVKMFIEQLYNPRVVEQLTYNLNPLRKVEVETLGINGTSGLRVLGFHFTRVIKNRKIVKILVSVRDLTDTVRMEARLEREQEQNDLQIEMISRMLNADESIMRGFLNTSLKQLAQINTILKDPGNNLSDLSDKIRLISQEIHAFKGEASVLNMSAFVLAAESFEDIIQQLKGKRTLAGKDFLPLVVELESLLEKVAQAEELHRKMTGRLNNPAPLPVAATATDLGTLFGRFVVNMGYRHNKSVIMETSGLEFLRQNCESFASVKDIIIQLLRNAVVHGIEPVRTRTLNGKPGEGRIRLNVSPTGEKIRILVEDDGRGIDFAAVRAKAVAENLVPPAEAETLGENQLYALLFRPGFSTLPENNHDAGRGIGMDVVRTRVKALNGRIALNTEPGQYTRITITLPYE